MENQTDVKKRRQRRLMLMIPVLALPFLTVMFIALGGGKSEPTEDAGPEKTGFNLHLPDAEVKNNKSISKMDYYNQAQRDSLKFQELIRNDPGRLHDQVPDGLPTGNVGLNTSVYNSSYNDPNNQQIYQKLAQINTEMNRSSGSGYGGGSGYSSQNNRAGSVQSADVDRLEQMMQMMTSHPADDPEMKQLSGMLDKIMEIQNPQLVQEKLKQSSAANRGKVFPVTTQPKSAKATLLDEKEGGKNASQGFYSLEGMSTESFQNAIQAVIHETQELVNGSTVKLRLVNDIFINGTCIPKDNFLYGVASLDGERLVISITGIRFNNALFPVELKVYDMDGLDGLYIPGAITRDVAKQSADRSMQNLGITSVDPSWGAQAASAGIEAAKSLIGRKVKLIKVTVKAGYRVLLRDEKQKENN